MRKTPKSQAPAVQPTRLRPLNLTVPGDLADVFAEYCRMNRKAGSISRQVVDHMIRTIAKYGHRYGLKLPQHLAQ